MTMMMLLPMENHWIRVVRENLRVCLRKSIIITRWLFHWAYVCVYVCVYKNMCLYGSLCIFIYIFKNTDGFINISRTHFFTWKTATRKATSNDEYVHIYFWDIHTLNFYLFIFGAEKKTKISFIFFFLKVKKNPKIFMHAYLIGNLVSHWLDVVAVWIFFDFSYHVVLFFKFKEQVS